MGEVILEARGLSKFYGGLGAVRDLSFEVVRGEIFGIAGPNGAGKTTLFDVISGHAPATDGAVLFEGRQVERLAPHAVCQAGIARTFQIPAVFPRQTVLANAVVGAEFGRRPRMLSSLGFDATVIAAAREALAFVGLDDVEGEPAGRLSIFDTKRLMIASALATQPTVMLFDEPVGGLNPRERQATMDLIRRVREGGITILLIEHVMAALMALSDRVMIMNHGEKLYEGSPADVASDADVVRVYLGTERIETARGAGPELSTAAIATGRDDGQVPDSATTGSAR